MTIADVNRAVARLAPHARDIQATVRATLEPFCSNYKYPTISRIKSEASLIQKIETGRYKCLLDVDDIIGFTIIIPTGSHEQRCREFLEGSFEIIGIRDRARSVTNPRQFVYDSTRVYCKIRTPVWEDDQSKLLYKIIFEVQIQTALEHAWVVATHDLVYKSGKLDWQKVRLAAQVKAQIETIDLIFHNFGTVASSVEDREWREGLQVARVISFFEKLRERNLIPSEKMPEDRIRLAENAMRTLSKTNMDNLEGALTKILRSIEEIVAEGYPYNLTLVQLFTVAVVRSGCNASPSSRYTSHITDTFLKFFPEVKVLGNKFDYNEK